MPAKFLYNLTKNLTAHLTHNLCAVLLVIEPDSDPRSIRLEGDMKLGRAIPDAKCDIKLSSGIVSRDHGEIMYYDGAYYYRDNNSLG